MHPNLPGGDVGAQANFDAFCAANKIDTSRLVGLRIDPLRETGADIAKHLTPNVMLGSVACAERLAAHAFVTAKDTGVFVLSGDCYPIVVSGTDHYAVGHVGWRSVDENLPGLLVRAMRNIGYTAPSLQVEIGPGIARESNTIPAIKARQQLGNAASFWNEFIEHAGDGMVSIDLRGAIQAQLQAEGVNVSSVHVDPRDTYTDPELFSRRASLAGEPKPRGNHVFVVPAAD